MSVADSSWVKFQDTLWYCAALLTAITASFNILIVLAQKESIDYKLRVKFIAYSCAISFWSLNVFVFTIISNSYISYICANLLHFGAIFIPILLLDFVLSFFKIEDRFSKLEVRLGYFLASTIILINIAVPKLFVSEIQPARTFSFMMSPGVLYPIWMAIFFYYVITTHIKVFRSYLKSSGEERTKLAFFVFPSFVAYFGCISYFFPVYNLYAFPFPWGCFGSMVFSPILAYGIIKHKLLGADVIIRRTVVFAGLFAFTYGTLTAITIIGNDLFRGYLGWNQWMAAIPTVFVITFAMRPIENLLTNLTEKFLFQKKYDYRELLRTFTNEVLTILDLQKLTEQTIADLLKIIKLESACILLRDDNTRNYIIAASSGIKNKDLFFESNDALINYLKQSHQPLIKDKEAESMEGHSFLRDDFKKLNAQLCLPIAHHDQLLGVLCLGMKKSGEEFTPEDIDILMTLARTEGIAIANAQLFDQLSKTQAEAAQREKMAVIGTLAAGINHEICNPLGIVRGQCEMFLLNLRDGLYGDKSKEDLMKISTDIMNKVIRETDRATAITKRLSGFAKPAKKIDTEEVSIEKETEEVLGLVGHDLKLSNIEFKRRFDKGFPTILADRRQIQEVLFNIIRNAAQAMDKKDGEIVLSGSAANGVAVIKIQDNGSGIPKDKIGQIFNPFFTTKEPGKGTGLGLFIVRQVVERNHGTIAVDSEEGVGTTFTLTFPVAAHVKALAA